MADDTKVLSIKTIPFNGKKDRWSSWKRKFLVMSSRKGYKDLLLKKETILTAAAINALTGSTKTDAEADKEKQIKLLELGFEDLVLSIDDKTQEGKVVFKIIESAVSAEFPEGDATIAWERLIEKFEPKETGSRLELRDQFQSKTLKSIKVDPEVFMTEI